MRRVIEIDADDMDALKATVMSVGEMCNTLQGRIYSAVAGSKDIQVIDVNESPGHWSRHGEPFLYKCSKCNTVVTTNSYKYCPYCGTRMI